jgi:hypothetical protein
VRTGRAATPAAPRPAAPLQAEEPAPEFDAAASELNGSDSALEMAPPAAVVDAPGAPDAAHGEHVSFFYLPLHFTRIMLTI